MIANILITCNFSLPKFDHGDFGPGFFSASMRSNAAAVVVFSSVTYVHSVCNAFCPCFHCITRVTLVMMHCQA
eukprot:11241006-Ditylum_brightwellii.AAC.1